MQGLPDSIYLLIEEFDNFAVVGGVTLPQKYQIQYSLEGHGPSFLARWTVHTQYFTSNGKEIDQNFFVAQK